MDFNDTPDQAKFRATCREWLEVNAELKEGQSNAHGESSLDSHLKTSKDWQKKEAGLKEGTKDIKTPERSGGFDKKTTDKKDPYHK